MTEYERVIVAHDFIWLYIYVYIYVISIHALNLAKV